MFRPANKAFSPVLPQARSWQFEMEKIERVHSLLRLVRRSNYILLLKLMLGLGLEQCRFRIRPGKHNRLCLHSIFDEHQMQIGPEHRSDPQQSLREEILRLKYSKEADWLKLHFDIYIICWLRYQRRSCRRVSSGRFRESKLYMCQVED